MTVYTKPATEVFAPEDAAGNPREVVNHDAQVWGTEVERSIEAAALGLTVKATWAELAAIPPTRNGQPGRVTGPDAGTHTDPVVGGTVANMGEYAGSLSPLGWQRVGDTQDVDSLEAEIAAARGGEPNLADALALKASTADLALKAPIESPALTGTPTAPTAPLGTSTDQLATTEYVGTEINDYVDRPVETVQGRFYGGIADDGDNMGAGLLRESFHWAVVGLEVGEGEESAFTVEVIDSVNDWAIAVADSEDRVAAAIKNDGTPVVYDDSGSGAAPVSSGTFDYDINGIVQYGQSNAMGAGGLPLLSTTQLYTALMFGGGGIRPWNIGSDPAVIYQAFVPLVEDSVETGVAGICDMIMERAIAENGISPFDLGYQIQASSAAQSGRPLSDLAKGGTYYPRFLEQVEYAALRSADLNKTFALRCVPWIQGEADTASSVDPTTYKNGLKQMRTDMQADIAAYVPNNPLVQLLVAQVNSHRFYDRTPAIALAQLDACAEDANLHMVMPTYFLEYFDDVHSNGVSKRWMGAYFGLAYKRLFIDQEEWVEFRCVETVRQGRAVTLRFDVPEPPIVFDTEWIADPGNYGFTLLDNLSAPMTIDSISVVSPSRIRIVASADIPVGATVQYAFGTDIAGGTQSGRFTGARGCLRDSQGDRIVFDPNGIDRPMHNWCPLFQATLT